MRRLGLASLGGAGALLLGYALYRYALGSGVGYDALEYLVIGRELAAGATLYEFAPSKAPGIYVLIELLMRSGWTDSRVGIAALVAVILVATAAFVVFVLRNRTGWPAAVAAALAVVLIALASELNFVEPTAFVFASGLGAWAVLSRRETRGWLVVAGLVIGVGIWFKAVAAFYLFGIGAWLLSRRGVTKASVSSLVWIGVGAALPSVLAAAWFLFRGQFGPFVFWTFEFPLLHYPPDASFLGKFVLKLGWMLIPVLALVSLAFHRRGREALSDPPVSLGGALAVSAAFALYKSQASHYAFPALAFVPILIALVHRVILDRLPRTVLACAAIAACALLGFAISQRPDVSRRVFARPDDSWGRAVAARFAPDRAAGRRILALQGTSGTAWVTRLRPLLPSVSTDVQGGFLLQENPRLLARLVAENPTAYVELDPAALRSDAPRVIADPIVRAQYTALALTLQRDYVRVPGLPDGLLIWQRREP